MKIPTLKERTVRLRKQGRPYVKCLITGELFSRSDCGLYHPSIRDKMRTIGELNALLEIYPGNKYLKNRLRHLRSTAYKRSIKRGEKIMELKRCIDNLEIIPYTQNLAPYRPVAELIIRERKPKKEATIEELLSKTKTYEEIVRRVRRCSFCERELSNGSIIKYKKSNGYRVNACYKCEHILNRGHIREHTKRTLNNRRRIISRNHARNYRKKIEAKRGVL